MRTQSMRCDAEHERIVDECYQCKLCYVVCPYTPDQQQEWVAGASYSAHCEHSDRRRRRPAAGPPAAGAGMRLRPVRGVMMRKLTFEDIQDLREYERERE
jgi:hypothetical protein